MDIPTKYYADSMAFIGLQGQLPVFDLSKPPQLSLAHLTSVPPFIKNFQDVLTAHRIFVSLALSNSDVQHIKTKSDLATNDGIGLFFGMQHAPDKMTQSRMQKLHHEGLQSMAIAYDGPNEYGAGFKADGGLTDRGKKLIEWMSMYDIILDLSHANHQTARDALDFICLKRLPMRPMASHSGCYSVFPHPRNLPDDILKEIANQGGYVGIPAITFLIAKEGDDYLETFAWHIAHAINVCDNKTIGVGSDCNHLDMTMEAARGHFETMTKMLKTGGTFREYFPDRPLELILNGSRMFEFFDHAITQFPDRVLGENFKEFLNRSLPRT